MKNVYTLNCLLRMFSAHHENSPQVVQPFFHRCRSRTRCRQNENRNRSFNKEWMTMNGRKLLRTKTSNAQSPKLKLLLSLYNNKKKFDLQLADFFSSLISRHTPLVEWMFEVSVDDSFKCLPMIQLFSESPLEAFPHLLLTLHTW